MPAHLLGIIYLWSPLLAMHLSLEVEEVDSWPLKVTFSTCKCNMFAKGHNDIFTVKNVTFKPQESTSVISVARGQKQIF